MKQLKCPTCQGKGTLLFDEKRHTWIGPNPVLEPRPSDIDRGWEAIIPHDPGEEPTEVREVPIFERPKMVSDKPPVRSDRPPPPESTAVTRVAQVPPERTKSLRLVWPVMMVSLAMGISLGVMWMKHGDRILAWLHTVGVLR